MPTTENSSAGKTFSMSRWAMMLPIVARRSPAITTPPGKVAATIVVPCGARSAALPAGSERRAGSRSGACGDQEVGERGGARLHVGSRESRASCSLAALLDERLHEVLGVRLEHVVDLVEDRVDVVVERFLALGDVGLGGRLGRSPRPPRTCAAASAPGPSIVEKPSDVSCRRERCANSSRAVSQRSISAPTWALLPRSGSMVGTRCSDSRPGRSKMTESQDAAATCVGVLLQAPAAEVGAGLLRRLGHRPLDLGVVEQPLDPAGLRPAGGRGPSPAGRRSTGSRSAAASRRPTRGRRGRGTARAACSFATQSSWSAQRHRVALEPVEHGLPAGEHVERLVVGVGAAAGPRRTSWPGRGTPSAAGRRSAGDRPTA